MNIKLAIVFLTAILLVGCSIETEEKLGPDNSWWLGGDDGGVFVKIQDDEKPNDVIYTGKIYFEAGEKIWYQGRFKLHGKLDFSPENHQQYLFWDGEKLHLQESSFLEPLDSIPKM
jgi:hypothetical protein